MKHFKIDGWGATCEEFPQNMNDFANKAQDDLCLCMLHDFVDTLNNDRKRRKDLAYSLLRFGKSQYEMIFGDKE